MIRLTGWLTAFSILSLLPCVTAAQETLLGQRVFWKSGAAAKVGNTEVNLEKIPFPATVEDVNGDWVWLGSAWVQKQNVMTATQALGFYSEQIRSNATVARHWNSRGAVRDETGDYDNAIKDYTEAIRLDPQYAKAYGNRGNSWEAKGKGDYDKAIKDFNDAIRLAPKDPTLYINRAGLWQAKGDLDNALKDLLEALKLDSKDAKAYGNRGVVWESKGDYEKAVKDYTEAIRLDSRDGAGYSNLAWLEATCPDEKYRNGRKAVDHATKACELSVWKDPAGLDTLAGAYAESGDFKNAVKWQQKAIEMTTSEKDKTEFQARLKLYEAEKPFREK